MPQKIIRIATRKSPLALWQANHIRDALLHHWPQSHIELLPMTTSGDRFNKDKLTDLGGKGLFVKELEEALLDKRADIAVHSMKDVPATFPQGLTLAVICKRQNPFDSLISITNKPLKDLPAGAVIGTSSLRRQSQLLALRPDLCIKPLRGNINTRIGKLRAGEFDAIILAAAGLERLGLHAEMTEVLSEELMLPAPGQGALGIECRSDDKELLTLIAPLNDPLSALCVHTERRVNAQLGGNCHTPLAIFCTSQDSSQLLLHAKIATVDGRMVVSNSQRGALADAITLADNCVAGLIAAGGADLLVDAADHE